MIVTSAITPCAKWTLDCQDFDGRLVSVSTRYWPRGGGFHILNERGEWEGNEARPDIRPSASAKIALNHGDPDQ